MQAHFAGLRREHVSFYTDKITDIEELFEHVVVHGFVLFRANFVAIHVDLHLASSIRKNGKRGLTHDAFRHQAACDPHVLKALCAFFVAGSEFFSVVRNGVFRGGIRVYT